MADDKLSILQICSARVAIYGAVQSLMTLAQAQRSFGHRVEFITFEGKQFGGQVRERGYPVHEIRVRGKIDPRGILAMRRTIRNGGFDVVHTHLSTSSVNGTLAARLAKVPVVSTVHGMSGKLSFIAADHMIAVSQGVKTHLTKQGISPDRISVVYNGIEPTEAAARETMRGAFGFSDDEVVIGTVCRITPLKGIEYGLRAFAEVARSRPNLRYLLVGDGEGIADMQALALSLGIEHRVTFAGFRTDVADCLRAMDLFLFPSLLEAMGIALVEAMSAGLPIVASEVGGIPEVLAGGAGLMVPKADVGALAGALETLLADPARMQRMGTVGRHRAETHFSTLTMREATDRVYRRMIDGLTFPAIETADAGIAVP